MKPERDFEINLLVPGRGDPGPFPRARYIFFLAIALAVLAVTATGGRYWLQERGQRAEISRLEEQLKRAAAEPGHASQALRQSVQRIEAEVKAMEKEMIPASEILTAVETALPPETRLLEMAVSGGRLVCRGVTADYRALADLIIAANRQPHLEGARCILAEPEGSRVRFEVEVQINGARAIKAGEAAGEGG